MAITKYERQVAAQAIQPAKLDNVDVSGGARAWAKAADSLGNAVKSVGEAYTKYLEEANELRSTENFNGYQSVLMDRMNNSENGYMTRTGFNSQGLREEFEKDRVKAREKFEKDLSPAQIKIFRKKADEFDINFGVALDKHVLQQQREAKAGALTSQADKSLELFVVSYGSESLTTQSINQLNENVEKVAAFKGWDQTQKDEYRKTLYGKAVSGRIDRMMSIPAYYNNPHLALSEFRRLEKMGLVNAKCREAVMKQLKPQLDRVEIVGHIDKYMKRVSDSDVSANKGNTHGKIYTGQQIINQIWTDKSIPDAIKASVVAGVSQQYASQKAADDSVYAQNLNKVIAASYVPGANIASMPEYAYLTEEHKRKLASGSAFSSDTSVISGFYTDPINNLTVAKVDAAFRDNKLKLEDYQKYRQMAQQADDAKRKADFKFIEEFKSLVPKESSIYIGYRMAGKEIPKNKDGNYWDLFTSVSAWMRSEMQVKGKKPTSEEVESYVANMLSEVNIDSFFTTDKPKATIFAEDIRKKHGSTNKADVYSEFEYSDKDGSPLPYAGEIKSFMSLYLGKDSSNTRMISEWDSDCFLKDADGNPVPNSQWYVRNAIDALSRANEDITPEKVKVVVEKVIERGKGSRK